MRALYTLILLCLAIQTLAARPQKREVVIDTVCHAPLEGTEIIPLLRVIDGFFDEFAQEVFIKAFGVNTTLATDILHARLDMMMHRRKMEDVYTLPDKKHVNLDLKVEGGNDYTIPNVKKRLMEYAKERLSYHTKRMPDYQRWWDAAISFFDNGSLRMLA